MPSADPAQRLHDIIENIARVEAYTAGMSETAFLNDRKVQDAVQYCLLRISEASVKLGPLVQSRRPEIRWRELRGLGNRLRHEYDRIEIETVWAIVQADLPSLKIDIRKLLEDIDQEA